MVNPTIPHRTLFHFNQHLNPYALAASRACYRGLLQVLRQHPSLPVNIHISGTLIHALQWLDPEPLELIRDGVAAGQFELLGSTYAQNVPFATDDWDNGRQIERHQRVIEDVFGVAPTAFWNPERCWRQSLLPVIAGAGYRCTLIEDHILDAAGCRQPIVITTTAGNHSLIIIRDDERLKQRFNFAVWFGRPQPLQHYLDKWAGQDAEQRTCLAYAEDAEAMGLWGWHRGVVPNQTWLRLDRLLTSLEARPDVAFTHLSNVPAPAAEVTPIPDGSATWMDASLQHEDAPYHEDGYRDWFDFLIRSPKLAYFRQLYDTLRADLLRAEAQITSKATQGLYDLALHNYLTHQYEFGCIGIGGEGYRGWQGARASRVLTRAAHWAAEQRPFALVEDVNLDGREEVILCDGRQVAVTTPAGGRLLYWFDLESGRELVGNQAANVFGRYEGDSLPPLPLRRKGRWLPETVAPIETVMGAEVVIEEPPTRLGPFLDAALWLESPEPVTLLVREMEGAESYAPAAGQRRALLDKIALDSGAEEDIAAWLAYQQAGDGVNYERVIGEAVELEKGIALESAGLVATYTFRNTGSDDHHLRLTIVNELCPDYASIIRHGRPSLRFQELDSRPAVVNTMTGAAVAIEASLPAAQVEAVEAFLALEIQATFNLHLPAGAEKTLIFRLIHQQA